MCCDIFVVVSTPFSLVIVSFGLFVGFGVFRNPYLSERIMMQIRKYKKNRNIRGKYNVKLKQIYNFGKIFIFFRIFMKCLMFIDRIWFGSFNNFFHSSFHFIQHKFPFAHFIPVFFISRIFTYVYSAIVYTHTFFVLLVVKIAYC